MTYQPFLIAPFRVGLDLDLDPWLLPEDAFAEIKNAHLRHGVIEKRQGFKILAQAAATNADFRITAATNTDPVVLTLVDVTGLSDGDRIQVNYVVGMTQLNGNQYLVANKTGGAGGTIELQDLNGNDINGIAYGAYISGGFVSTFPGDRIMGIGNTYDSEGNKNAYVWDSKRGYFFDKTNQSLEPLDLSDIFDSGEEDYVMWTNWSSVASTSASPLNRIYFTNGKAHSAGLNGLRFYSAATEPTAPQAASASLFRPTINGGNAIDGAQFVFAIKQRLLLIGTIEGATVYAQRMRWCAARRPGTPGSFTNEWNDNVPGLGGFVDAPTSEHVVTAQQLQDSIIVWFTNSVWIINPTNDPRLPFKWDKINSFRGADARAGSLEFDRYSLGVSIRGISATDSNETKRIDDRVQDFVTDLINSEGFGKTFCARDYQLLRTWILYVGGEEDNDEVNGALILDDESGAWSIYDISMNVLGHGQIAEDTRLDDFPDSPTSLNPRDLPIYLVDDEFGAGDSTLQDYHWEANDELFLGGDIHGFIYELNEGQDDNGIPIEFSLKSAAWNPYKGQGVECELGWVDFYVDASQDTTFVVNFYKNNMDSSYASKRLDCLPPLKQRALIQNIQPLNPSTDGYLISANGHGLSDGDFIYIYGITGPEFLNAQQYQVSSCLEDTFIIAQDFSANGTAITSITSPANPGVVTASGHPFIDGDEIVISGGQMTQVIGNRYVVADATVDTFELQGVNTTGFTPYVSDGVVFPYYEGGGIITELPFYEGKVWKRAYAGGMGYWHQVEILQQENNTPFRLHGMIPYFKKTGDRMI